MGQAVRGALQQAGCAPEDVEALAIDTTCCTVVSLDDQGEPLRYTTFLLVLNVLATNVSRFYSIYNIINTHLSRV